MLQITKASDSHLKPLATSGPPIVSKSLVESNFRKCGKTHPNCFYEAVYTIHVLYTYYTINIRDSFFVVLTLLAMHTEWTPSWKRLWIVLVESRKPYPA